jgi:hypothetical protein
VVGGVFLLVFIALIVVYKVSTASSGAPNGPPVGPIRCDTGEQLAVHYHAHVEILHQGTPVTVPAQIGIPGTCFYWMHTHDTSGIVHIEAPRESASSQFTLGQFFAVWGQPLSSKQVATLTVAPGEQVKAWVNGQPYTGDLSKIVLKSHEQVVIEIGPPFTDPPPTFTWDQNNYPQ